MPRSRASTSSWIPGHDVHSVTALELAAIASGVVVFLLLASVTFASTSSGGFAGVVLGDGGTDFVFVGLTQILLCAWLWYALMACMESKPAMLRAVWGTTPSCPVVATSTEVGVMATICTWVVAVHVAAFSSLCWFDEKKADDDSKGGGGCRSLRGAPFHGSPMIIELCAVLSVLALVVAHRPLPARRARLGFIRCVFEALGFSFGYPAFGPFPPPGGGGGGGDGDGDGDSDREGGERGSDREGDDKRSERGDEDEESSRRPRRPWREGSEWSIDSLPDPPSSPVDFRHVLLTDALTSAGLMLWQTECAACLFATGSWTNGADAAAAAGKCVGDSKNALYGKPIVLMFPFWLRLWQCVAQCNGPLGNTWHAVNAMKYLSCIAVTIASTFYELSRDDEFSNSNTMFGVSETSWYAAWVGALCFKTVFCFWWDVVMDWGLARVGLFGERLGLAKQTGGAAGAGDVDEELDSDDEELIDEDLELNDDAHGWPFLRPQLLYSPPMLYYVAVAFDFAGRLSWGLAISPHWCDGGCTLGLGLLELLRRVLYTGPHTTAFAW